MKSSFKISSLLAVAVLALGLAACGDSGLITGGLATATTAASTTAAATTAPATTPAATTAVVTSTPAPATTAAPTTAVPVSTTVAATTAAPTTAAPTTAAVTTAAPTTKAASTTAASVAANAIRQTDWAKVLQNDPQLKQEQPFEPFKIYISVKAADTVTGAPDLDNIVYVDMDKDGLEEAGIPLISGGTAGNTGFLLYRYAQPAPRLVGWQEGYKQGLKAVDGKLVSTNALYSGWEPNCCPSGYSTITYSLTGDKLAVASSRSDGYVEAQPPTVTQFYDLISAGELKDAYAFLSASYQKANPYDKWAAGFATTEKVTAEAVADKSAPNTVKVNLESTDSTNGGGHVTKKFSGTWKLAWNADRKGWLLDEPKITEVGGTSASTGKVLPLFQAVLPDLKKYMPLPVYFPTTFGDVAPGQLYASIAKADATSYYLSLDFSADCNGANACHYGSLSGEATTYLDPQSGQKVSLAGGQTGYFNDAGCGASCSEATLSWEKDGVRYTIGSKAAKLQTLVNIANSAITNGPV